MKIDPSKKYTCNGHPVEFLHRKPEGWPGIYQWAGIANGWMLTWTDEGIHEIEFLDSKFDLVEVREPMRVKMWVKDGARPIVCVLDTELNISKMNVLGYTLKEFVEVLL
jgi:hypothetical protein